MFGLLLKRSLVDGLIWNVSAAVIGGRSSPSDDGISLLIIPFRLKPHSLSAHINTHTHTQRPPLLTTGLV